MRGCVMKKLFCMIAVVLVCLAGVSALANFLVSGLVVSASSAPLFGAVVALGSAFMVAFLGFEITRSATTRIVGIGGATGAMVALTAIFISGTPAGPTWGIADAIFLFLAVVFVFLCFVGPASIWLLSEDVAEKIGEKKSSIVFLLGAEAGGVFLSCFLPSTSASWWWTFASIVATLGLQGLIVLVRRRPVAVWPEEYWLGQ